MRNREKATEVISNVLRTIPGSVRRKWAAEIIDAYEALPIEITDAMIEAALDGCGRRGGEMGPNRMRAALEAALNGCT